MRPSAHPLPSLQLIARSLARRGASSAGKETKSKSKGKSAKGAAVTAVSSPDAVAWSVVSACRHLTTRLDNVPLPPDTAKEGTADQAAPLPEPLPNLSQPQRVATETLQLVRWLAGDLAATAPPATVRCGRFKLATLALRGG